MATGEQLGQFIHCETSNQREKLLYLLPNKLSSHRYQKFIEKSKKMNLPIAQIYQDNVTHVISELDSTEDVIDRICMMDIEMTELLQHKFFLKTQFLSDCLKTGRVVEVSEAHLLPLKNKPPEQDERACEEPGMPEWACMRKTPLTHHNHKLTDAIEVLEQEADLHNDETNYSRSLAFRRCIAVLKACPQRLTRASELRRLPHVGDHCQKVIQEVLEEGMSQEVIQITDSESFKQMRKFTSVFGVGSAKAQKWMEQGLQEIEEASTHPYTAGTTDERVIYGVAYHRDLTLPVLRREADAVVHLVQRELQQLLPGATAVLTGGFRRGKDSGHDIDILISHPEEGREAGLLPRLLRRLNDRSLILHGKYDRRTDTTDRLKHGTRNTNLKSSHDEFEKWYGILKLDKEIRDNNDVCRDCVEVNGVNDQDESAISPLKTPASASGGQGESSGACGVPSGHVLGKRERDDAGCHGNEEPPRKVKDERRSDTSEESDSSPAADHTTSSTTTIVSEASASPFSRVVEDAGRDRKWRARRVDLVVSPAHQYHYALVGWTGSKFFNRDLRLYAQRKLGMKLSSHALWDSKNGRFLPASSEQEVFDNLRLEYREPWDRNA